MTRRPRSAAAIRSLRALAALVLAGALLAGCTGAPEDPDASARPVTTEESQLLAVARFRSFDAGSRPFTTEVRERGADLQPARVDRPRESCRVRHGDRRVRAGGAPVDGCDRGNHPHVAGSRTAILRCRSRSLDDQAWLSHPLDPSLVPARQPARRDRRTGIRPTRQPSSAPAGGSAVAAHGRGRRHTRHRVRGTAER